MIVCGFAVAMVACGGKKVEEAAATETVVADSTATDTTASDSAAVK